MTRSPTSRPGLSLTEVLVALFVMALGIISLMTLFPLGAVQMGQALRDDRSGQTASQADGITRIWWQTQVVEGAGTEQAWLALDNPGAPLPIKVPIAPAIYDNNPSYPVFVDPIGWQARGPSLVRQNWVGETAGNVPRRSMNSLGTNLASTIRACSMMDDITFKQDGTPDTLSGSTAGVVREGAFNWCAVIQRPNNANRYVADFKVLVFHTKGIYGGHIPGIAPLPPLPPLAGTETVYAPASAIGGSTQVILPVAIANLPVRTGSWIMDGSNVLDPTNTITHKVANFYRIQSITELTPISTILELDTPLKSTATQIYIIRGLADVFDRPQLTNSGYHRQAP